MPHPNSLMYNVYVIPFWPMKVYWTIRKVSGALCLTRDDFRQSRSSRSTISRPLLRTTLTPRSQEPTSRSRASTTEEPNDGLR